LQVLRAAAVLLLLLAKSLVPAMPPGLVGVRALLAALQGHVDAKPLAALRELCACLESHEGGSSLREQVRRVRALGTAKDPTSAALE
jgi:hypothetical protein